MFLADVIGTVVTPVQHPALDGMRQLLLRPLNPDGKPSGKVRIGLVQPGGCGAGEGDRVIVMDEGNGGRQVTGIAGAPIKTIVMGVVDSIEYGPGETAYFHMERAPLLKGDAAREGFDK
jgi:ethanolamine utilization protein EutN